MKMTFDYCDKCMPKTERKALYLVWREGAGEATANAACSQHLQLTIHDKAARNGVQAVDNVVVQELLPRTLI